MSIDYDPKDASKCWPEADYDATLKKVESRNSNNGNPMDVLTIEAYDSQGRRQLVTEYITAASVFKLKQLAVAIDKRAEFEARKFQAEDALNSSFRVHLTIEEQPGYDDKNRVGRFLPSQSAATKPASALPAGNVAAARPVRQAVTSPVGEDSVFKDSDIPF